MTLGLIAVPIKVSSATEDKGVHFHQVHAKDGVRIKQRRVCSKEGIEVPYAEVAKGYEVADGEYVLLSKDEIAAAAGEASHRIALEEFVRASEVDPVFYDRTYYLNAGDDGERAYRLLHDALERSRRVGVGRWIFHNREYLVAVRAMDGVLALHTMRFADELVSSEEVDRPAPSRAPSRREIDMATALVDSLHARFDPQAFKDSYRARVLDLIERKAKGEEIERPPAPEPEPAPDLLAALQASLDANGADRTGAKSKSRSRGKSTARRSRAKTAS